MRNEEDIIQNDIALEERNWAVRFLQAIYGQMVPFASATYRFSTHWQQLNGEPDYLTKAIGDVGYWQVLVIILMMMFNTPVVFHINSPEVAAVNHDFWCKNLHHKFTLKQWRTLSAVRVESFRGLNVTDPCTIRELPYSTLLYDELLLKNSSITRKCFIWEFDGSKDTVLSRFSLACTALPVNNIAEGMFSLGAAVGGLLNSYMADKFGRKKLLMGSQILNVLIGFGQANSPTFSTYLFYRVALGFSCSSVLVCSLIICLEITGGKWRNVLSSVYMLSFSLGYVTLYALSELFNSWVHLQYSITLMGIFLLAVWWMVPESPRWLLTVQNLPRLMQVLKSASDINRRPLMPGTTSKMKNLPAMRVQFVPASPLMLFRGAAITRLSTVTPFAFFFCSLNYFGLVLNSDLFTLGLLYSGAIEFIACVVVLILGLKNDVLMVTVTNGLSGLCCLVAAGFIRQSEYLNVACIAARFFGGMTNTSLTTIVASMYPTLIRTLGLGWGYFFSNVGLAVAANIVLLSGLSAYLPLIVLGVSGLLGSCALMFLPGRISRDLPDLPEEVEYGHQIISAMRGEDPRAKPIAPRWSPENSNDNHDES